MKRITSSNCVKAMKICLLIVALIVFAGSTAAQKDLPEWSRVFTTDDRTKVDLDNYYAIFSGERSGRVRFRWLYVVDQKTENGAKYRFELNEFEFDCADSTYRLHRREVFDKSEKSLEVWQSKTDDNWKTGGSGSAKKLLTPACWLLDFRRQNPVREK